MKTIEVKTAELEGAALDWAVAIIEGYDVVVHGVGTYRYDKRGGIHCCEYGCTFGPRSLTTDDDYGYSPSTDWSRGGPMIEKFRAYPNRYDDTVVISEEGRFFVLVDSETLNFGDEFDSMEGSTPLIAACRAIVAAKLGDTVQVPADLIGGAA